MQLGFKDIWRQMPLICLCISMFLSVAESLQCYTCYGVPYYDPDLCFSPVKGRTVRQECNRGEVCETRIHRSEIHEKVVERGCTNACGDRTYVWTDYFQVHCCSENDCNAGHTLSVPTVGRLGTLVVVVSAALTHWWWAT